MSTPRRISQVESAQKLACQLSATSNVVASVPMSVPLLNVVVFRSVFRALAALPESLTWSALNDSVAGGPALVLVASLPPK